MGMTIDEATLYMELYKRKLFNSVSDLDKDIEAYDLAIETMRKYQNIQEIVKFGNANELGFEYVGEKITEVLEDGFNKT